MDNENYDDPEVEERWCKAARQRVSDYLQAEGVKHGRIGEWPAWHIAPVVSVWAVESLARPEWIGWWAIHGDLPTDYISSAAVEPSQHPRKALRVFGENWRRYAQTWSKGGDVEGFRICGCKSHKDLAPLLASRAEILIEWADDDSLWEEE